MSNKKIIAYYLPQFHEIKENNEWWGPGFTEWTALKKAKTYFKNQEIRKPVEPLGYYSLDNSKVMEQQYELACENGVEAFCIWTYWFGKGETILQKPLENILKDNARVKYCIAWANHSWFNKTKGILLKEQKYLGEKDYKNFFKYVLPHFKNEFYIKNNNRPVVTIFDPNSIPDLDVFINCWQVLAKENGFNGIYFIGDFTKENDSHAKKLNAFLDSRVMYKNRTLSQRILEKLVRKYKFSSLGPVKYDYEKMITPLWSDKPTAKNEIPIIFSGWDTTIRHGRLGVYYDKFNMSNFEKNVRSALKYNDEEEYVFLKSWNEWAEGNTVEPDSINGNKPLEIISKYVK
ncbi:glycosyltransferase WbsX family protein [Pantoea eucrina]|uniref:glycosyltransferase WbsX family protein n=1 Tax=Pantoea eucrina TaxID=472693 RepID=UPI002898D525|nr:glycoside hydrolase family 99-like domain-containing protein [Pantoea eucrina]